MKFRLLAFAAVSTFAMALTAQAAPPVAPGNPAKPVPGPVATPPTLPTSPEDTMTPSQATPAVPATPATPATPGTPAVPATPATKAIPPAPTDSPPVASAEPAPAFRAGAKVSDSSGADIGVIQSIAESSTGAMIVLKVDGKLVSVPQGTLAPFGENVKSSQTKAEILAAAPK